MKYYTMRAGNCKLGETKTTGNPYIKIGCVIKSGPEMGTWHNFFMVITDKSKERVKRDLATMGVLDTEPFTTDGRLFTGVYGYDEFWKEDRLLAVKRSTFEPNSDVATPGPAPDSSDIPF